MGEIADSMLGGEMCAACGEWLGCMTSDEKIPKEELCSWMEIPVYCSPECVKVAGYKGAYVCPH